jgi:hypothetical protein
MTMLTPEIKIGEVDFSQEIIYRGPNAAKLAKAHLDEAPPWLSLVRLNIGDGERVMAPSEASRLVVEEFYLKPAG